MFDLKTICLACVGCLVATSGVWAATTPPPAVCKPFATIVMPKTPLTFNDAAKGTGKQLVAKLTPKVLSNHPYRLAVSFSSLKRGSSGIQVPPNKLTVKINGKVVPVGTTRVEIKTGPATTAQGVVVPIIVEVTLADAPTCPAGEYAGGLTFYIQ
jgi:hypothetical protein